MDLAWGGRGTLTSFIFDFDEQRKETPNRTLSDELPLTNTHTHRKPETPELNTSKLHSAGSPHKYNWHLNIWKRRNRERERVSERQRGSEGREIFSLYTKEFKHWQSNNTINECIIILLDIHWWSKRDGKAWLVTAIFFFFFPLISGGNPPFVSSGNHFFNTFFFIITPYSSSFLNPTISSQFPPPCFFPTPSNFQGRWRHPSGSG